MLFAALFLFFILLNSRVTLEVVLVGIVVCALADVLACRSLGWDTKKSRRVLFLLPEILSYAVILVWEILKANAAVLRVILDPKMKELDPILFTLPSDLESDFARTVLADSITITPGTYTVAVDNGDLRIHCLGQSFYLEEMQLVFQRRLVKIEKKVGAAHV